MAVSFDKAFGVHDDALKLRTMRAEILAHNLANADTPGFKARDIDFRTTLQQAAEGRLQASAGLALQTSHARHLSTDKPAYTLQGVPLELKYRQPSQASMDDNTVETEQELARFARNAGDFQASMTFLSSRIRGLLGAIKGE